MNTSFRFLMVALVVCAFAAYGGAETNRREGEVRGTFVKLIERQIGQREYVGVVVRQFEGAGEVTLLMSRGSKAD